MKTFTKIAIALALVFMLAGIAPQAQAQTAVSTTTLGAAITVANCSALTVTVASTTGMQALGTLNQPNTVLYVDTEYMWVNTVPSSTTVTVQRCHGASGQGATPRTHANGAAVWFQNTSGLNPASSFSFKTVGELAEAYGSCVATQHIGLPIVYLPSGHVFQCLNTSSGGQWIQIGTGTMNTGPGVQFTAYCTTTVGSAETDFLNNLACSGATSSLPRNVVTKTGTLYGLTGTSSANFLGTGGSVLTVLKNGVATAIVCAPTAATKTCSDTAHSVAVVAGDVISFSFLSATSDTAANVIATVGEY